MKYEKALDFLLFSYFGLDNGISKLAYVEKNRNEIIAQCAKRAYLDLSRTVEYSLSTSKLAEMQKKSATDEDKDKAKKYNKRKEKLVQSVSTGFCNPITEEFDQWHETKCGEICKTMDDSGLLQEGKNFTYGQAQKWVNMTIKYLWLLDLLPDGIKEGSLHVPIDSFILQELKNCGVEEVSGSGETYHYKDNAWSAISDPSDYKNLQEEIKRIARKDGQNPIQWEKSAWMKIAMDRQRNNT